MKRATRLAAVGGAVVLTLLGSLFLVTIRGLIAAQAEEEVAYQQVADRLFDEMERELDGILQEEEARSFLEYRYFFVPDNAVPGKVGLLRSPLADGPSKPWIRTYFQLDEGGTVLLPTEPPASELAALEPNRRAEVEALNSERRSVVEAALAWRIDWQGADRLLPAAPRTEQAPIADNADLLTRLNRGGLRSDRRLRERAVKVADAQAQTFDDVARDIESASAAPDIDARVTGLVGQRLGGQLLLHRTLELGGETFRQGLVIDLEALQRWLADSALGVRPAAPSYYGSGSVWSRASSPVVDPGLTEHISLVWDVAEVPKGRRSFEHTFAPPFDSLRVQAAIASLPSGEGSWASFTLIFLAAVASMVTCVGAVVVGRAVNTELTLAERRSNFVSAVTHELKTPLTSIRLYSEMLLSGMVAEEAQRLEYYGTIHAESERLSRLIQNVLDLGRIERQQTVVRLAPGRVEDLVERVLGVVGPHVQAQGFELEVDLRGELPEVMMDLDAMTQVLVNVVDNAVKFSAKATDRRISICAEARADSVCLDVRDRGPGAPRAVLAHMFEPFFRGETELVRQTKGTGIGLALARAMLRQMGGHIRAKNHVDGGLVVEIRLPRVTGRQSAG